MLGVSLLAGLATVFGAILGEIVTCIDNDCTTSVAHWIPNDLRTRIYGRLHRIQYETPPAHPADAA